MTQVIPAIIPFSREQLENEIKLVADFASLVQVDISDGKFTSVKTWPHNGCDRDFFNQLISEKVGWPMWEHVNIEVHLMIENPEETLLDWIHSGASGVVVHIESFFDGAHQRPGNFQEVIDLCRENQVSIGLALKPSTDIVEIEAYVSQVDFVQVMGNDNLGHHDVELEQEAVELITKLRQQFPDVIIGIDIGVNENTAEELARAGATRFIVGSSILEAANPKEEFEKLSDY